MRRARQIRRASSAESGGSGSLANTELAEAPAQRARIESEDVCGAVLSLYHPPRAFEHAPDMRALHFLQRAAGRGQRDRRRFGWHEETAAVEHAAARHDHCALDQVFELTNIARPVIGHRALHECWRNPIKGSTEPTRRLLAEVSDEHRNIVPALA